MTSRTPQQQREYMRTYMRDRRASRRTARIFDHAHRVTASSFDIGNRHELRDGSGVKMWPERVIGDDHPETIKQSLRRIK